MQYTLFNTWILLLCGWSIIFANAISTTTDKNDLTLKDRLQKARSIIRKELHDMKKRWEIDAYPNFLYSASLSKHAWEVMKLRLQRKILLAGAEPQSWLISFTGSSVTAGRDSPLNSSFIAWTQRLMEPALRSLRIGLRTTNNAMENNPCVPYDLCVRAFAGEEADMIHWEQSFNCEGTVEMYEQFTRQALSLPSKPIVIFSHSASENWREDQCKTLPRPHVVTDDEKAALKLFQQHRAVELFTSFNSMKTHFSHLSSINTMYKAAGIQTFFHADYVAYKCLGPYEPDFGCCSAPWHPSLLGHELRGAHHSMLWLFVLLDAVSELHKLMQKPNQATADILANVTMHSQKVLDETFPLRPPLMNTQFVDGIQCYTDLQPRNDESASLRAKVVATKLSPTVGEPSSWAENVYFKQFINPQELEKDLLEGRTDQVICLVGNVESGPIHFALTVKTEGLMFVCFATGFWGKQPKDFTNYEVSGPIIYITYSTKTSDFIFDKSLAENMKFQRTKEHGEHCVTILSPVKAGNLILTVEPTGKKFITVATILVP